MNRPIPRLLLLALLATLVGSLALVAAAQSPKDATGPDKSEPDKGHESVKPKDRDAARPKSDKGMDGLQNRTTRLPPGFVILPIPLDRALSLWPATVVVPLERFQAVLDEMEALKRQLKGEKKLAHSCDMSGRLEGDYLSLRGEFTFATQDPRTTVLLGLKGGFLTEKGDIDGQVPLLDYRDDDGFTVRALDPGDHRLVLLFRVPVAAKRSGSGAVERGLELGLPGTLITTLTLELPAAVKEIRWNENLEKTRVQGKWFLALGNKQTLNLSWREPAAQPTGGPHLTVDGKIKVRVGDTHAEVSAELALEDPRGQTKTCQLLLPPRADVKVEAPPGVAYEMIPSDAKTPNYTLRFLEPTSERWLVTALVRVPRPPPGGRLPIGPFYVQGAEHQRGTITILAPADVLRRERLIYHRFGDVFQRDTPKLPDVEAVFQYWGLPDPSKVKVPGGSRVPLELEAARERGPLEAKTEHVVKLRRPSPSGDAGPVLPPAAWEIDLTTRLHVKSLYGGGDSVEVQLPRSTLGGFQVSEEGGAPLETSGPDENGRCRVLLPRSVGRNFTLTIAGRYTVDSQNHRLRVGLPRALGISEQTSKVMVQTDEGYELLVGPPGLEEPVPEKHRYQFDAAQTPEHFDVAWRPHKMEFPVTSVIDVLVHERTAQVRQRLMFGTPPRLNPAQPPLAGQVQLQVPAAVKGLTLVNGDARRALQPEKASVLVSPTGEEQKEIVLEYDLALSEPAGRGDGFDAPRGLEVQAVWPRQSTRQEAKVRVWCSPGTRVRLDDTGPASELWQDRGVEAVAGHDLLPCLVLRGDGPELPLRLRLDNVSREVIAVVCDRALIQAAFAEDDGLACRARYLVSRINAETLEVEFPVPVNQCKPQIRWGGHEIAWEPAAAANMVRIPLKVPPAGQPVLLDIEYRLGPATQEGRLLGLTTLYPPVFRSQVEIARTRWQLSLASPVVAFPVSPGARSDYRWSVDAFLLYPEPSASSAELESWLTGREPVDPWAQVSVSFWRRSNEAQRVVHLPRLQWVLLCSGLLVLLFLIIYFLPRWRFLLVITLGLLALGVVALDVFCPAPLPALFYGAQPGLAVIILALGMVWLLQERYRRQVVFIPGFTRLKAGSSVARVRSNSRQREATTVDAPAAAAAQGPGTTTSKK
jgi:hypothetical protein